MEDKSASDEIDNELLTAYLDGELPDAQCISVEKRLAEDPAFHQRMRELQSAWELLDGLPLARPDSQFLQTTIEMATAGLRPKRLSKGVWLKRLLLLIPISVFGLGYFLTRESIEQPERELVFDLPLIENHDRYTKVIFDDKTLNKTPEELAAEGMNFLKSLHAKGLIRELDDLFLVEPRGETAEDFEGVGEPPDQQSILQRVERLSRLTDEQRSELLAKKEKFEALPEREKETLLAFHTLLSSERKRKRSKLVEMLNSYYDWLKILGASQRATILDSPLEENRRLIEISRITRRQASEAFGTFGSTKLPLEDAVGFYQWYQLSIRFYEPEIRERTGAVLIKNRETKGLPPNETVIDRIKSGPLEQLVEFLMRNDRERFGEILCSHSGNEKIGINDLREIVSEKASAIIDDPSLDPQELILKWIEAANLARFPIKEETLRSFYAELDQEQRDELDNQEPSDWYQMLTRMYWDTNIGRRSAPSEEEAFEMFLRQSGYDAEFDEGL